jgi:ribA/ribD-fused uncharacterized protein
MDADIFDIKTLKKTANEKKKLKFIFFWGHTANDNRIGKQCFSQWFPCKFKINGNVYNSAEQYMMAEKAKLFGDNEIFEKIINERQMKTIKDLGRKVKGFSEDIWADKRFQIVYDGNLAKFIQNLEIKDFLLSTGDKIIVEASPYDKIWGIGMSEIDPHIENVNKWKGLNLLGFALMKVRSEIKKTGK